MVGEGEKKRGKGKSLCMVLADDLPIWLSHTNPTCHSKKKNGPVVIYSKKSV